MHSIYSTDGDGRTVVESVFGHRLKNHLFNLRNRKGILKTNFFRFLITNEITENTKELNHFKVCGH